MAAAGEILYAMGGRVYNTPLKIAECYDSKMKRWFMIAPMNVERRDASAAALNGNMNPMR
jgi:hypothetical protein